MPRWKTSVDLFLTLSSGFEEFPDNVAEIGGTEVTRDGGEISRLRGTPSTIAQLNISFQPAKNWYVRLENVYMSSWLRRGLLREEQTTNELFFPETDGYYNLDVLARYQISKSLQGFVGITNVLNSEYGGIGATGFDIDLFYNPQLMRTFKFGITFTK